MEAEEWPQVDTLIRTIHHFALDVEYAKKRHLMKV